MDKIPGFFHVQNLGHGDRCDGDNHRIQIESLSNSAFLKVFRIEA